MGLGQIKTWQGQALRGVFSLKYLLGKERIGTLFENVQENLVESLKTHFETEGSGKVRPVAVEHNIDLETFRTKYQAKNRPVVLKGAAANWECVRKWDLNYLSNEYGSDPVDLLNPSGLSVSEMSDVVERSTLGDFIREIQGGGKKYLRFHPFLMDHPELLEDLDLDWISSIQTRGVMRPEYQMFVGPAGSHTPVHCAMPCNLFVQVHGKKNWLLFEPNDFPMLNPKIAGLSYYISDVDPEDVDTQRFPLFQYLNAWEVNLEPGDVFWNPPYMWHCVTNETPSIGIGYRFNNPWLALKASPTLLGLRVAARNPNVFQSLYYALKKTNLIVSIERDRSSKKT
jgi:hypothetical protein